MKKLIVPVLIGIVMFGLAFGGAFFLYGYFQGRADEKVKDAITDSIAELKKNGRLTPMIARLSAVVPTTDDQTGERAGPVVVIPGTIRYQFDPIAVKPSDAKWDEEAKTVRVKLPPLTVSGPDVDYPEARYLSEGGALARLPDAERQLNQHDRITAQVTLLEQGKAEAQMAIARNAARKEVQRVFERHLHEADIKAKLSLLFPVEAAAEQASAEGETDEAE